MSKPRIAAVIIGMALVSSYSTPARAWLLHRKSNVPDGQLRIVAKGNSFEVKAGRGVTARSREKGLRIPLLGVVVRMSKSNLGSKRVALQIKKANKSAMIDFIAKDGKFLGTLFKDETGKPWDFSGRDPKNPSRSFSIGYEGQVYNPKTGHDVYVKVGPDRLVVEEGSTTKVLSRDKAIELINIQLGQ